MKNCAFWQKRCRVCLVGITPHPVVVIADTGQSLNGVPPDCLKTHSLARRMQMGLEGNDLGVLLEHAIGMQLLPVLIARYTDVDAIAQAQGCALVLGLIAFRMKAESNLQMAGGVEAVGVQMHGI